MTARLRLRYSRDLRARDLTQSDILRLWEGLLGAARLHGPAGDGARPRLAASPPLPRGATSDYELVDVTVADQVSPKAFRTAIEASLPEGIRLLSVEQVGEALPSLQAAVRWSDYIITPAEGYSEQDARQAIDHFLALTTLDWQQQRESRTRRYDIRQMVAAITLLEPDANGRRRLWMRLRCDPTGTGRPEQVLAALGLGEPQAVHRERLVLDIESPVRRAWLKMGRFRES